MTPGDLARVEATIDELTRSGTATTRAGDVHELFPVAIPRVEGEALRRVVEDAGAARSIETGLGYGVSTLYICAGLLAVGRVDATHLAIDPHQHTRFADLGLDALARAGLRDIVEHVARPSEVALPSLLEGARRFDVAFVDGNHRFDGVFVDLFFLGRLLRPAGRIFLDDYQLPGVRRAAAFSVANLGWSLDEVSDDDDVHQWAVLTTSAEPDERPFDLFVEF
jgi:predicted O-methyltransferase YrrM